MSQLATDGAYYAANGHIMVCPERVTPNGMIIKSTAFAYCAPECSVHGACAEGEPLEDW